MRGGARPGAGRKLGWRKGYSEQRPRHAVVALDDEWEMIKRFVEIVKKGDKQKCETFLQLIESGEF